MKNGVKNSLTHETCFLNVLVTWTETLCTVPRTIFYTHPVKFMVERCALNGTTGILAAFLNLFLPSSVRIEIVATSRLSV